MTVGIVSFGNAAVDNVRDKLDGLGFGHVIGNLGRKEKREEFFAGQVARAHRLEPDPDTAPIVRWMFAQRLARHSLARITRGFNDAAIPHAAAGITTAFSTTVAMTSTTRCSGATSWPTLKVMPSDSTVAPTEMAMPVLNSAVSSWSAVTPAPPLAQTQDRRQEA
jgi:hypothetical protein